MPDRPNEALDVASLNLEGKVVVVTGASRGLGAGLVKRFAELGLKVGACARTPQRADETEAGVAVDGVDVIDAVAVERWASQVAASLGPIDLWINNAGVLGPVVELRDLPAGDVGTIVDTNVTGTVHGMQTYIRHRRESDGGGVLVNISSGAARSARAGFGLYCATKAAVQLLIDLANIEESGSGLRAYALEPGVVDTDMQVALRAAPADQFPDVARLRRIHERGEFNTTRSVADFIIGLAFGPQPPAVGRLRMPSSPHR